MKVCVKYFYSFCHHNPLYSNKLAPCGRTVLVHHVPGSLPTSPSNPQSCQCELSHELFPIPVSAHVWGDTAAGTITPSLDLVQFVIDHAITWMPHFPEHHLPATPSTTERITPRTDKHARAVGCLRRDTIRPLDQPTQRHHQRCEHHLHLLGLARGMQTIIAYAMEPFRQNMLHLCGEHHYVARMTQLTTLPHF